MTRKAIIRKGITRKLNTAKYETIDLMTEIQVEIEYDSPAELLEKADSVRKLVAKDYMISETEWLDELNLESQNAFRNDLGPKRAVTKNDFDSI